MKVFLNRISCNAFENNIESDGWFLFGWLPLYTRTYYPRRTS